MFDVAELFRTGENLLTELTGNGDFRSSECLELMDEADIVVTNPPFSLFREYLSTLIEHQKSFIIIGNQNAISYKDVFYLLMNNQVWVGATYPKEFVVPSSKNDRNNTYMRDDGTIVAKFGNVCWFTNLDLKKRHEEMILVKRYSPSEYLKYDNYDAIEISKMINIPYDYSDPMGVPITFLDKYNPDQFEIIGADFDLAGPVQIEGKYKPSPQRFYINSERKYARIIIRNKHPEKPKEC